MDIDYMNGYRVFTLMTRNSDERTSEKLCWQGCKAHIHHWTRVQRKDEDYLHVQRGYGDGCICTWYRWQCIRKCCLTGNIRLLDLTAKRQKLVGRQDKDTSWARYQWHMEWYNEPASFPTDHCRTMCSLSMVHRKGSQYLRTFAAKATYEGLGEKMMVAKRPFVLTRAAYAGSQKYWWWLTETPQHSGRI